MRKRAVTPPSAWKSLCGLAQTHGIDLEQTSLAEATNHLLSRLENERSAGRPLSPETVRLASLLVRLQGELLLSGATSAEPFIERAYARNRARLLARQLEAGPLLRAKPEIAEPPPEPPVVTLYDLVSLCDACLRDHHRWKARRKPPQAE